MCGLITVVGGHPTYYRVGAEPTVPPSAALHSSASCSSDSFSPPNDIKVDMDALCIHVGVDSVEKLIAELHALIL